MQDALAKRQLGSDGPEITRLGFGSWAIGGGDWAFGWGPQEERDSIAAIHRALEHGIDWIDTAAAYGLGHAEEIVARALRGMSDPPLVFTKCGLVWQDQADRVPRLNLRPDEVRRECEDSLRRLEVERIDLLQFHWPDTRTGTEVEQSWGAVADLVAEGVVRRVGVSNFDVPLLRRCEPIHHVDSLQPPFNAIDRAAAAELLPWCVEHGTGVIVYSPMMSGLLTDRWSRERSEALAPGDWRRNDNALSHVFFEPELTPNLALRDALRPIAERHGASVAAVAVAWTLTWPGVTGAIVGGRSAAQVDGWIAAGHLALDAADLEEIAAAVAATGAGEGPADPRLAAGAHG